MWLRLDDRARCTTWWEIERNARILAFCWLLLMAVSMVMGVME